MDAGKLPTFNTKLDDAISGGGVLVGVGGGIDKSTLKGRVAILEVPAAK